MADQSPNIISKIAAIEDKIENLIVEFAKIRDSQDKIRETMEGLSRCIASLQASSVQREPPPLVPPPL